MPLPPPVTPTTPGLTRSALDIISAAMRLVQVLGSGEVPSAAEGQDGLVILNQMMDSFQADRLMVYTISIQDFPLVASQSVYTLGPGGNFDTVRPAEIERASIVLINNPINPLERPLQIYLNEKEWQDVSIKAVVSTFPLSMYDDGAYPLRNLTFWPIPTGTDLFRLYSWAPLTQFADLSTPYAFPPAYQEMLKYNLALRIADEFGGVLGATVAQGAVLSMARVKIANTPRVKLACDEALCGSSDPGVTNYRSELFNIP